MTIKQNREHPVNCVRHLAATWRNDARCDQCVAERADPRVAAIRDSPMFGAGSCSPVDECYDDGELIARLDELGKTTVAAALEWAGMVHEIFEDRMADAKNAGSW